MYPVSSAVHTSFVASMPIVVLLVLFQAGDAMAQNSRCDPKLGRDYDQQTAEVKMARLNGYLDCRQLQDNLFLQAKRRDMLTGIQKWQNRADRVIVTSLRTKRQISQAEQKTIHQIERDDHEADFRDQFAVVEAARTTENRVESDNLRLEVSLALRAGRTAMRSRQNQEQSSLQKSFRRCYISVNAQIVQFSYQDTGNIQQQFLDKSARLQREYTELKAVPMSLSPNDFAASQSSEPAPTDSIGNEDSVAAVPDTAYQSDVVEADEDSRCEIVFADETTLIADEDARMEIDEYVYDPDSDDKRGISFLRGIFIFVSDVIGRKEPTDVKLGIDYTGIRG